MQSVNTTVALMQLDSLILGMEANSGIPPQLSELKTLKILLTTPDKVTPATQHNIPPLRAVPMGVFPTLGSLQEVVALAKTKIPVEHHNDLLTILFTYHNTLLAQLKPAK